MCVCVTYVACEGGSIAIMLSVSLSLPFHRHTLTHSHDYRLPGKGPES